MATRIAEILAGIRELEADLEREWDRELREKRRLFHYRVEAGRVRFEERARRLNRRLRKGWFGALLDMRLATVLSTPLIYSLAVPLALLDLWVQLYQAVSFPALGIAKVRRRDYLVLDRRHLDYLNVFEKAGCAYCSYANGLIGFVREVASRTEQFFCPIQHARPTRWSHPRMHRFFEYGDAAAFRAGAETLRAALRPGPRSPAAPPARGAPVRELPSTPGPPPSREPRA